MSTKELAVLHILKKLLLEWVGIITCFKLRASFVQLNCYGIMGRK